MTIVTAIGGASPASKAIMFLAAVGAVGFLTYKGTKRTVTKRCRTVVKRECMKIPVFGEKWCTERAEEICDE